MKTQFTKKQIENLEKYENRIIDLWNTKNDYLEKEMYVYHVDEKDQIYFKTPAFNKELSDITVIYLCKNIDNEWYIVNACGIATDVMEMVVNYTYMLNAYSEK